MHRITGIVIDALDSQLAPPTPSASTSNNLTRPPTPIEVDLML